MFPVFGSYVRPLSVNTQLFRAMRYLRTQSTYFTETWHRYWPCEYEPAL